MLRETLTLFEQKFQTVKLLKITVKSSILEKRQKFTKNKNNFAKSITKVNICNCSLFSLHLHIRSNSTENFVFYIEKRRKR